MNEEDEKVIESGFGRPILKGRAIGAAITTLVALGSIVALVFVARASDPMVINPSPSPSPSASGTGIGVPPVSFGDPLVGTGPFLLFTLDDASGEIRAVDLGARDSAEIVLGAPPGDYEPQTLTITQAAGSGLPILVDDIVGIGEDTPPLTRMWRIARGEGLGGSVISVRAWIERGVSSPDGTRFLAMKDRAGSRTFVDMVIYDLVDGSVDWLGTVHRSGSPDEGFDAHLTPVAWLPDGGWLAVPICDCGNYAPHSWFMISATGELTRLRWLGVPNDSYPGVSRSGRFMSFVDQRFKDCGTGEFDRCPDGPMRILVADTSTERVREIARFKNELSASSSVMSPDGSRVAVRVGSKKPIYILDARSGARIATLPGTDDDPVAFIDPTTLIVTRLVETPESFTTSVSIARLTGSKVSVTTVLRGVRIFLGWIR